MKDKKVTLSANEKHQRQNVPKKKILTCYWLFAALRLLLCIIPQTGYIHPDEFFQSIEVMAGHYFDIDTYKPWEFNTTFPVRTCLFPFLTVGVPFSALSIFNPYFIYYFGITLKTPYFLVVFPRIFMCVLSFMSDFCLYRICKTFNYSYEKRLIFFASSYVTLIYATRTFSNSIELILSSLILYYVSRCMNLSKKVVFQGDFLSKKYNSAGSIVDRVKYYKLMLTLPSHSLNDCLMLATITIAGIFNRPTFVAFAFPPIFFWLQRGLGSRVIGFVDFHFRIFAFILCTIPASIFFIIVDSFYFGYLTWGEIGELEIGINNFVVTPLNFFKYNSDSSNLKIHGLHPRFLHFLINVPLLFNILGIIGIHMIGKIMYSASKKQWLKLPRIQSIEGLMISSFVVPVALLSIFPHQEPRFIIPVLVPLCFLCAPVLCQFSTTNAVISVTKMNGTNANNYHRNEKRISKLERLWYTCNVFLAIFYGFVHQGGVLPLTSYLASELKSKPELTHVHLFTSHIYSIPTALLLLRNTRKVYISSAKHKYKLVQDFHPREFGSKDLPEVYDEILMKLRSCKRDFDVKRIPYRIYYAFPASFYNEFQEFLLQRDNGSINYETIGIFYPHVSTEKLPSIDMWSCLTFRNVESCVERLFSNNPDNFFVAFVKQFGLVLVKLEPFKDKIAQNSRSGFNNGSNKLLHYLFL